MPTTHVTSESHDTLQEIANSLLKARKVVVVTGAGISTNSGIPDFRSENGLYSLIQRQFDAAAAQARSEVESIRRDSENDDTEEERPAKRQRLASEDTIEVAEETHEFHEDIQEEIEVQGREIEVGSGEIEVREKVREVIQDGIELARDEIQCQADVICVQGPDTDDSIIVEGDSDGDSRRRRAATAPTLPTTRRFTPNSGSCITVAQPPTSPLSSPPPDDIDSPFSFRKRHRGRLDGMTTVPPSSSPLSSPPPGLFDPYDATSSDEHSAHSTSPSETDDTPPSTNPFSASQSSGRALPNMKGKDMFDASIWSDPLRTSIFYQFATSLRQKSKDAEPTVSHRFIKHLRDRGKLVRCYTQNIDQIEEKVGLSTCLKEGPGNKGRFSRKSTATINQLAMMVEEAADTSMDKSQLSSDESSQQTQPSSDGTRTPNEDQSPSDTPKADQLRRGLRPGVECVYLHGSLERLRCFLCGRVCDWEDREMETLSGKQPECPFCVCATMAREEKGKRALGVGKLRPDIVLYGEEHPNSHLISPIITHDLALYPDILLILGTSLKVHGLKFMVREFAKAVHSKGGKVVFVNFTKPPESSWGDVIDYWVEWDCDAWVGDLTERIPGLWEPVKTKREESIRRREESSKKREEERKRREEESNKKREESNKKREEERKRREEESNKRKEERKTHEEEDGGARKRVRKYVPNPSALRPAKAVACVQVLRILDALRSTTGKKPRKPMVVREMKGSIVVRKVDAPRDTRGGTTGGVTIDATRNATSEMARDIAIDTARTTSETAIVTASEGAMIATSETAMVTTSETVRDTTIDTARPTSDMARITASATARNITTNTTRPASDMARDSTSDTTTIKVQDIPKPNRRIARPRKSAPGTLQCADVPSTPSAGRTLRSGSVQPFETAIVPFTPSAGRRLRSGSVQPVTVDVPWTPSAGRRLRSGSVQPIAMAGENGFQLIKQRYTPRALMEPEPSQSQPQPLPEPQPSLPKMEASTPSLRRLRSSTPLPMGPPSTLAPPATPSLRRIRSSTLAPMAPPSISGRRRQQSSTPAPMAPPSTPRRRVQSLAPATPSMRAPPPTTSGPKLEPPQTSTPLAPDSSIAAFIKSNPRKRKRKLGFRESTPSHTQATPSHKQATPSHTQATPSHTQGRKPDIAGTSEPGIEWPQYAYPLAPYVQPQEPQYSPPHTRSGHKRPTPMEPSRMHQALDAKGSPPQPHISPSQSLLEPLRPMSNNPQRMHHMNAYDYHDALQDHFARPRPTPPHSPITPPPVVSTLVVSKRIPTPPRETLRRVTRSSVERSRGPSPDRMMRVSGDRDTMPTRSSVECAARGPRSWKEQMAAETMANMRRASSYGVHRYWGAQ